MATGRSLQGNSFCFASNGCHRTPRKNNARQIWKKPIGSSRCSSMDKWSPRTAATAAAWLMMINRWLIYLDEFMARLIMKPRLYFSHRWGKNDWERHDWYCRKPEHNPKEYKWMTTWSCKVGTKEAMSFATTAAKTQLLCFPETETERRGKPFVCWFESRQHKQTNRCPKLRLQLLAFISTCFSSKGH